MVTRGSHSAGLLAFGVIEQDEYSSWRNTVTTPTGTCTIRTELGGVIYTVRFVQLAVAGYSSPPGSTWMCGRACAVQSHRDSPQPSDAGMELEIVENPALRW